MFEISYLILDYIVLDLSFHHSSFHLSSFYLIFNQLFFISSVFILLDIQSTILHFISLHSSQYEFITCLPHSWLLNGQHINRLYRFQKSVELSLCSKNLVRLDERYFNVFVVRNTNHTSGGLLYLHTCLVLHMFESCDHGWNVVQKFDW
jgi:hypothetical protein